MTAERPKFKNRRGRLNTGGLADLSIHPPKTQGPSNPLKTLEEIRKLAEISLGLARMPNRRKKRS
ncbi:hypothetical protein HYW39_00695 [Candidatus Curtissbacteria bacterium]|nr:hypothetical protein [Candidatus Curtissbacteria bacterium]